MADERTVVDNPDQQRYELWLGGHLAGVVKYHLDDDVLTIPHVEVRPELRGRGYAEPFLDEVLADARRRLLRLRPTCWYARGHIEDRPHLHDLLA